VGCCPAGAEQAAQISAITVTNSNRKAAVSARTSGGDSEAVDAGWHPGRDQIQGRRQK
jgi:hypothetical protein